MRVARTWEYRADGRPLLHLRTQARAQEPRCDVVREHQLQRIVYRILHQEPDQDPQGEALHQHQADLLKLFHTHPATVSISCHRLSTSESQIVSVLTPGGRTDVFSLLGSFMP